MPEGLELRYFGDGQHPVRKPTYAISATRRFHEYLRVNETAAKLFGAHYSIEISMFTNHPSELRLASLSEDEDSILAEAERIFEFFDTKRMVYGHAELYDERFARNLHRYDLWGNGRMCTSMIGTDILRYVPGLYWLNYLSHEYLERHRLDLLAIAHTVGGTLRAVRDGFLLRLYDEPSQWLEHFDEVAKCIDANPSFFSMSRVAPLPPGLSPREYMERSGKLGREWP